MSRFKDPELNLHLPLLGRGTTQAIWSYSQDVSRYLEDMTSTQYGMPRRRYEKIWKVLKDMDGTMQLCESLSFALPFRTTCFCWKFSFKRLMGNLPISHLLFQKRPFHPDSLDSRNRSGVLDASKIRSFPFIWGNFPLTWSAYGRKSNLHFWAFMLDSSGCCWVSVLQDPISSMPEDARHKNPSIWKARYDNERWFFSLNVLK